ncbi:HAMP domain-containing sensor histidine kinase [Microlunatus spumicola]|uniref:histidine kinase n=1 Tax=Microlunatus spumicola TaxID=81499 RepID=A0ABP6X8T1_9ACTN
MSDPGRPVRPEPSAEPVAASPDAGPRPRATGRRAMGSVSIRVRVVAAVMAVLAVVLVALSFSVQAVFTAQSDRNVDALLSGRAQLARQLARSGVRPQQVVNRVGVDGVLASLQLRDGTVLGSALPVGSGVQTVTTRLVGPGRADGAQLTLSVNSSLVDGARQTLRRILLLGGIAALVLSALLVSWAVRLALRPLTSMAALAQRITAGSRGERLSPTRTDTEVGGTAQALDTMLDELEGAEAHALRAEAQALRAEAQALQAEQRTRAFLADAAHELRTPLAGIRAATETLVQHGSSLEPADRDRLELLLVGEVQRAGRLVEDLLAVARLDAGLPVALASVDLGQLLREEVDRSRLLSPTAQISSRGEAPPVDGDAAALRGLVRNLLDNARRAAGPTGAVEVTLATSGPLVVVHVRDDGPGVPAHEHERIFDRLVRLDAARGADDGGSGLGLTIARATARAHGGDLVSLAVEPPARGADFLLTLPSPPVRPRPADGAGC